MNDNAPRFQVNGAYNFGNGRQKYLAALSAAHDIDVVAAGSDDLSDIAEIAVIISVDSQPFDLVMVEAAGREGGQFCFGERDVGAGKKTGGFTRVNAYELQQHAFGRKAHSLNVAGSVRVSNVQTLDSLKALGEVSKNLYPDFTPHTVGALHPTYDKPAVVGVALLYRTRSFTGATYTSQVR